VRHLRKMVCGSIGYGGIERIRRLYAVLKDHGFQTLDHFRADAMDYSAIRDFRRRRKLSRRIVTSDLKSVKRTDVVVALSDSPSYGTAIEMYVAKDRKKKVILLAKDPVPTPWPVAFADHVVNSEDQLLQLLREME
jgi:nucleoside 2-deoxyribosyltransferase